MQFIILTIADCPIIVQSTFWSSGEWVECQTKFLSGDAKGKELDSNVGNYSITQKVLILSYEAVSAKGHMLYMSQYMGESHWVSRPCCFPGSRLEIQSLVPESQTHTLCLVSMSAYLPCTGAGTKSTSGDSTPHGVSGPRPNPPNPSLMDFRGYPSVTNYSTI